MDTVCDHSELFEFVLTEILSHVFGRQAHTFIEEVESISSMDRIMVQREAKRAVGLRERDINTTPLSSDLI